MRNIFIAGDLWSVYKLKRKPKLRGYKKNYLYRPNAKRRVYQTYILNMIKAEGRSFASIFNGFCAKRFVMPVQKAESKTIK